MMVRNSGQVVRTIEKDVNGRLYPTIIFHIQNEENKEEDGTEDEIVRSRSSRRSRAAAIHNWSKQRQRARINQKIKALQKLVPDANKTDKASMLDEVIDYLKKLQAHVQMMKSM
ncbi:hypothetical protein L1987_61310 [Smallanthus sonchifolius]|uniref:Uncharacterized protein n=1 Tax=Smallanthus sonchifolius TaxID=185202 RepID=A0ACB9DAV3_9ASTR|nr:hypothetical protein L1987_61310 [Smallanthus sonchifolius]